MIQKKLRGLVLTPMVLFILFWAVIFSATHIDAEVNTLRDKLELSSLC